MTSVTQCCLSIEWSPRVDDINSCFTCEQVLIYLTEEEIRLQRRKFLFGKSRKLILMLFLHFDNPLWCFLIAWLLQEGDGGSREDKCLRNKKTLFCESWKMVLALLFFFYYCYFKFFFFLPSFREVQENCWHWQKMKIRFMVTSCITQANLFCERLFFMVLK